MRFSQLEVAPCRLAGGPSPPRLQISEHAADQVKVLANLVHDLVERLALLRGLHGTLAGKAGKPAEMARQRGHLGVRGDERCEVFLTRMPARQRRNACYKSGHEHAGCKTISSRGGDRRKRFAAAHPQGQTHPISGGRP